ncbi:hypothetical protein [Micromonospora sp. AKA38]|uniref:hypothetical protein n=1 Tax=Micromonospora sp. AKA38 TaxID=2733861 RepID=UPI0024923A4E|nr:hypothetical protein [Micromonospora sp. AKA38]
MRGSTWRRAVFLLLGGVLALPYALLVVAFAQLLTSTEVPRPLGLGLLTAPRFWALTGGFSLTTLPMLLWPLRALTAPGGRSRSRAGTDHRATREN